MGVSWWGAASQAWSPALAEVPYFLVQSPVPTPLSDSLGIMAGGNRISRCISLNTSSSSLEDKGKRIKADPLKECSLSSCSCGRGARCAEGLVSIISPANRDCSGVSTCLQGCLLTWTPLSEDTEVGKEEGAKLAAEPRSVLGEMQRKVYGSCSWKGLQEAAGDLADQGRSWRAERYRSCSLGDAPAAQRTCPPQNLS